MQGKSTLMAVKNDFINQIDPTAQCHLNKTKLNVFDGTDLIIN